MSIGANYRPHYTYEDYCQWEGRWELIEGMPYAMSPLPVPAHQRVSTVLSRRFDEALEKCKKLRYISTHRLEDRSRYNRAT